MGWERLRLKAQNRPDKDGFVVVKATRAEASKLGEPTAQQEYLKKNIPAGPVKVALIPVNGGLLYTIWIRESDRMLVFHVGMSCM